VMQSDSRPAAESNARWLIACALSRETEALRLRLGNRHRYLTTGLGARKTQATLEKTFGEAFPGCLLFTGTAGQLDPKTEIGEVVLPEEWCLEGGACHPVSRAPIAFLRRQGGWEISERGLTVPRPVLRRKSRIALYLKSGARVCDMESAAAVEVANRFGVGCLAPKVVSDTADSGLSAFWTGFDGHMDVLAGYLKKLIACLGAADKLTG